MNAKTAPTPVVDNGRKATHQLGNLQIIEHSGVHAGDNPEAHVVAVKTEPAASAPAAATSPKPGMFSRFTDALKSKLGISDETVKYSTAPRTTLQVLTAERVEEEFWKLRMAYSESMYSIINYATDVEQMGTMLVASSAEFAAEAKRLVGEMKTDAAKSAELDVILAALQGAAKGVKDGNVQKRSTFTEALKQLEGFTLSADPAAPAVGAPPEVTSKTHPQTEDSVMKIKTMEEALKVLRDPASTQHADALKFIEDDAKAVKTAPAQDNAEVLAQLKGLSAKQDETNAALKKANERIEELQSEKNTGTFLSKARKVAPPGVDPKKLAKQLEGAYGRSKEEGEELEQMFRSQKAQGRLAGRLGEELGTSKLHAVEEDENSASGQLRKLAKSFQEKEPSLHWAVAFKRACDARPDLKEASLDDERAELEGEEGGDEDAA